MSTSLKGISHKMSENSKQKLSQSCMGRIPWNKGKKVGPYKVKRVYSEQARKNMGAVRKGRIPWNKGMKKKIQLQDI